MKSPNDLHEFTFTVEELEKLPYCTDCLDMVKSWPWEKFQHQAVAAMDLETCPLCKIILKTLKLKERTYVHTQNELVTLYSWADEGDPHADVTILRRPVTDPVHPNTIKAARGLLEECATQHFDCCSQSGNFLVDPGPLPRRVLQLGDKDGLVRLHQSTHGEKGVYATLSYRWGDPAEPKFELTSKTLREAERKGDGVPLIEVAALHKCHQDAIELARGLGIDFLWVDALCTLQDDAADRQRSVTEFPAVYENSAVCIRPANIAAVDKSFLRNEDYEPYPACVLNMTKSGDSHGVLKFTSMSNNLTDGLRCLQGSLLNSSWAIAESFVSPRHITITTYNELTYTCLESECGKARLFTWQRWARAVNESFTQQHYHGRTGMLWLRHNSDAPDMREWVWQRLVGYMQAGEGFRPEDRALILNSLARGPDWKGEYMNGLWKENARELLTWATYSPMSKGQTYRRLPNYPTWSFLSTTGQCNYFYIGYMANWQIRFVNWTRSSPKGLFSLSPTLTSTLTLEGKVASRADMIKMCGLPGLDLSAYEVDVTEGWTKSQDGLMVMVISQLDFGPIDNVGAEAGRGATSKEASKDLSTAFEKVDISAVEASTPAPLESSQHTTEETASQPSQQTNEASTASIQDGVADASKPTLEPTFPGEPHKPTLGSKKGRFLSFVEDFPRDFSTRRNPVRALMQRFPRGLSGRSNSLQVESLVPHRSTQIMFLRRSGVSIRTYERVALVTRNCEESWADFWDGLRVEEIHLV